MRTEPYGLDANRARKEQGLEMNRAQAEALLSHLWRRGTDFLGCRYAIMGGAMTWVSERRLVSAISNAGGFGVIASGSMPPEILASEIAETTKLTDRPFGVNLITLHPKLEQLIDACLDAKVGHVVLAGGLPPAGAIQRLKQGGAKVMCFAPAVAIAKKLVRGGADAIVIETQNDLVEAEAAIQGVREACDLPVGLSFTFDSGARRDRTMMGVTIAQACELARAQGASFAGANCGAGIETFVHIAEQFALCEGAPPIWIKGNAGLPEVDAEGRTMFKSPPQAFADAVEPLARAGARFIGGCCGSTPEHIRAIAAKIGELRA